MKNFKINIFNTEYSVTFEDKADFEEADFEEADFTLGTGDTINKKIQLTRYLPNGNEISKEETIETLLHEVIHVILDEGMYREESNSEPMVEWLTKCLYDLIIKQKLFDKVK